MLAIVLFGKTLGEHVSPETSVASGRPGSAECGRLIKKFEEDANDEPTYT